ncbi:PhzF family phenazine biosynthesis protein [Zunongwangia pacifica]|uniref:PhzF family phenazine biosynthesis protein n=1 Tax=Zunongwangia pacifica TaxID=2911062 RepID=A0A9X2A107_9FLAO|nr:PhzF family phenazine biosynthesis protein [Zunongwangia pacifica]MCL6220415.1 PhzF family phenazine biosynthesis protein [Zunongwangia pacifica]
MTEIDYYLVDVFTSQKYGGNQLAVFVDFENKVSTENMLNIARELNFPEITFVKDSNNNEQFDVRIFTPEYEVPFAGHPSLGTAFIISKYLLPTPKKSITLNLKHSNISIDLTSINDVDTSDFIMQQAEPEFVTRYNHQEIADGLNLKLDILDTQKSIEEITTGLPYIVIPVINLEKINQIKLDSQKVIEFLIEKKKYKTNSTTGLTTSLFFVTEETFEKSNSFNTRMFCIENGNLVEDAATGSANGCFLAYLLKNKSFEISATVEQGFQIGRKSYIHLDGKFKNNKYSLKIGGKVVDVSKGKWKV